jgi:signal transduction histidine kinase
VKPAESSLKSKVGLFNKVALETKVFVFTLGFGVFLFGILFWKLPQELFLLLGFLVVVYVLFSIGLFAFVRNTKPSEHSIEDSKGRPNDSGDGVIPRRSQEIIGSDNRFFSILSHEIRTPMTAISASTEVLMQGEGKLSEERKKFILKISSLRLLE